MVRILGDDYPGTLVIGSLTVGKSRNEHGLLYRHPSLILCKVSGKICRLRLFRDNFGSTIFVTFFLDSLPIASSVKKTLLQKKSMRVSGRMGSRLYEAVDT